MESLVKLLILLKTEEPYSDTQVWFPDSVPFVYLCSGPIAGTSSSLPALPPFPPSTHSGVAIASNSEIKEKIYVSVD